MTISTVPMDDPDLAQAMAVVDTLTEAEKQALLCSSVWAGLSYSRTGDVAHVTKHAWDLLGTLRLRGVPGYVEAVRRPRVRQAGESQDIGEVLASLRMPGARSA